MAIPAELITHLKSAHTHLCRCWAVTRRDGVVLGFTDHDMALNFEGVAFVADTGMTARALEQTSGLAVDNSEALGVLSQAAVSEADIQAGRYDGAQVVAWLVNWSDVAQRLVLFSGSIGEIRRSSGAYQAELCGLTEALNQPQGRVYQKPCSAILGDADCGFDLDQPGYSATVPGEVIRDHKIFELSGLSGFAERWFERGRLLVQSGAAAGLVGIIKNDRMSGNGRVIELWEDLRAEVVAGDMLRLEAGCDKRVET
ncbi:MAG: DUF2163 domain-containing protein, partial [Paracoccaceae bacterium]